MKTLLTIAFAAAALSASAQINTDTISKPIDLRLKTSGQLIEKGSSQMISSTLATLVGAGLIAFGSKENNDGIIALGAVSSAGGVVFTFAGLGKIRKGGREMYR